MIENPKPEPAEMALEEWKALSALIARLESTEYTMRNWLIGLISTLVVALNVADKDPGVPWYVGLGLGVALIALFILMDLVHRMPKRYAIERSRTVDKCLRGEIPYDGPRFPSGVLVRSRPGKREELFRMWDNTPYRHLFLLLVVFIAASMLAREASLRTLVDVGWLSISSALIYFGMKAFVRIGSDAMKQRCSFWSAMRRAISRKAQTVCIDITRFDKESSDPVRYGFSKNDFAHPSSTLKRLARNPKGFVQDGGDYAVVLTRAQDTRLSEYLREGNYRKGSFGSVEDATALLALSFGESHEVNQRLAALVIQALATNSDLDVTAQWEIADILEECDLEIGARVRRMELAPGRDYITTAEIVQQFAEASRTDGDTPPIRLAVVAQAWHAPRCIRLCKQKQLSVVAGRFADSFPADDPQEWTRNAIRWVLKEGTKE